MIEATIDRVDAEDRLRDLSPAGPDESREADDLAGAYGEADVLEPTLTAEAVHLQHDLAR